MMHPTDETREQRMELTKRAVARTVRTRIAACHIHQTDLARASGISRSYLRALLRADKCCSLFVFLELSRGLGADPCELLREVLKLHIAEAS